MVFDNGSLGEQAHAESNAPMERADSQDSGDSLRAAARAQVKLLQLLAQLVVEELNEKENRNC